MKSCVGAVTAALRESATEQSDGCGRYRIRIISPGQGSSGVYTRENLAASAPLFRAGTHMYMNHPTRSEDFERPERSVMDLVGVLTSDAAIGEDGSLYAECEVYPSFNSVIREKWRDIGVSINAWSDSPKESDGTIPPLSGVHSVDFVTVAGAGGGVVDVLECAREDQYMTRDEMVSAIMEAFSLHEAETKKKKDEEDAKAAAASTAPAPAKKADEEKPEDEKKPAASDEEKKAEDEKKKRQRAFESARAILSSGIPEADMEGVFLRAMECGDVVAALDAERESLRVKESTVNMPATHRESVSAENIGFLRRH